MENNTKSILIAGVGGQGTLLASNLLGRYFIKEGYDVKVSEVHGMSQRGGSVVTYVRYGKQVFSPVIDKGGADLIIAFEQLEAARWLPYLKEGGTMIINTQTINPMPVITGSAEYPVDIIETIKAMGIRTIVADASELAERCGNIRAANVVLLGAVATELNFDINTWLDVISCTVPPKTVGVNKDAFLLGCELQCDI